MDMCINFEVIVLLKIQANRVTSMENLEIISVQVMAIVNGKGNWQVFVVKMLVKIVVEVVGQPQPSTNFVFSAFIMQAAMEAIRSII